jgi:hypothetical protein
MHLGSPRTTSNQLPTSLRSPLTKDAPLSRSAHGSPAGKPIIKASDVSKPYTVAEDLEIYDLFCNKEKGKATEQFSGTKLTLIEKHGRSYESLRDRYKKYLKYLSAEDIETITQEAAGNLSNYFIHFEKVPDDKDKNKKRFKNVSQEDLRPAVPTRKPAQAQSVKMPRSLMDESFDREHFGKDTKKTKGGEPAHLKRPGLPGEEIFQESKKVMYKVPGKNAEHFENFDIRKFIPREYAKVDQILRLDDFRPTPVIESETKNYSDVMQGFTDVIQVTFDGNEFHFSFVKKPVINDLAGIMQSICQLLGVSQVEAERIYEGCSLDMDDLKAYIGGNKKLIWNSLEDEALINALADTKTFQKYYPILTADKGESSVLKRIEYLRQRKMIKASPIPFLPMQE